MSWRRPTLAFLLAPLTVPPVVIVLKLVQTGWIPRHGFLGVLEDIIGGFEASSPIAVNASPHDVVRHIRRQRARIGLPPANKGLTLSLRDLALDEQKAAGLRQMRP
jgi:hypothetical protein